MPSAVDVCNLALSHIGDVADVQSISPPDSSVQAGFCSRFYPIALQSLLEQATWDFTTRRANLALLATNPSTTWLYAYAVPDGLLNTIAVISPLAVDDYTQHFGDVMVDTDAMAWFHPMPDYPNPAEIVYTPQPFAMETGADGIRILLTNVCNAILRYTLLVSDANQFSALFVMALSYQLASMLAGPLIKGDTGAQVSAAMMQKAQAFTSQAKTSDANQRRIELKQSVPWMAGR
jgi:hypothetical protein